MYGELGKGRTVLEMYRDLGSKTTKGPKQDSQNMEAIQSKDLNRIAKIWEQYNQRT
jgi:hypothetical protein